MFAEDNVDGDISDKVEVSEDVNTSLPGPTCSHYSVLTGLEMKPKPKPV
jgi:hypothetical protein